MSCEACLEMCVEGAILTPHSCDGRPAIVMWLIFRRDGMYRVCPMLSIAWHVHASIVTLPAPSLTSARALLPTLRHPAPLPTWFPDAIEAWTSDTRRDAARPHDDAVPTARADGPTEPNDDVYVPEGACPLCLEADCRCSEPLERS